MRLSVCMIAKNEESFLANCLASVQGLVDEIILVDTGSTDKTKEIALRFGAKVFDFSWRDDFAAARNESLRHATGDWILVLDADEELDEEGRENIRQAINKNEFAAYLLPQLHYTNIYTTHPDFVKIEHPEFAGYYLCEVIRLFRNSPDIYFDYCVHETVLPSLEKSGLQLGELPAALHHYQERKGSGDVNKKQEYYFRLSLKNIEQYPHYAKSYNDVAIYYNRYQNDLEKSLEYCRRAVELELGKIDYVLHLGYILRDLGRFEEAVIILKEALQLKEDERLYRALGYIYYQMGDYGSALEAYTSALEKGTPLKEQVLGYIKIIKSEAGYS